MRAETAKEPRTMRDDILGGRSVFGERYISPTIGSYMVVRGSAGAGLTDVKLEVVLYDSMETLDISMIQHLGDRPATPDNRARADILLEGVMRRLACIYPLREQRQSCCVAEETASLDGGLSGVSGDPIEGYVG